ncbi:unnamed protein product [Cyprideis torosa]|uniref:Uncharacterized protein n=1 Tax=Cyprideis torosa TaxID=163714 RepID=A0A7R8ZK04_9CRUS|nr:unnamed protein product [Cyprideis torosa]CAG0883443.1 unnamed protein product [Cyprideis torosa]
MSMLGAGTKRYVVGLNPGSLSSPVTFTDENHVVYLAGTSLIRLNYTTTEMEVFALPDSGSPRVWRMLYVAGKETVALVDSATSGSKSDSSGATGTVTFYSLQTRSKKQTLTISVAGNKSAKSAATIPSPWLIKSIALSQTGKFLAVLSEVDSVHYWAVDKGKEITQLQLQLLEQYQLTRPASTSRRKDGSEEEEATEGNLVVETKQIQFNPADENVISIVGTRVFRNFRLTDGTLRSFGHQKGDDSKDYFCHTWLNSERCIVGTDSGCLCVFAHGDFKVRLQADIDLEHDITGEVFGITDIQRFQEGFLASSAHGWIYRYERLPEGDKSFYQSVQRFRCESGAGGITSLAISNSCSRIACLTSERSLCFIHLTNTKPIPGVTEVLTTILPSFHTEEIVDLSVATRMPLAVTVSKDKHLCVWEYHARQTLFRQDFSEFQELFSVSIHPHGILVALGTWEGLQILAVHLTQLVLLHSFPQLMQCSQAAFSYGGHLLAVATSARIHLICVTSLTVLKVLVGHTGIIRNLKWCARDTVLLSCSEDGSAFSWAIPEGTRASEMVLKGSRLLDQVSVPPDGQDVYVVDSEKSIYHLNNSQLRYSLDLRVLATSVALSLDGRLLFIGTEDGHLISVYFPLDYTLQDRDDSPAHHGRIVKMMPLADNCHMLTVGVDGTMILWAIHEHGVAPKGPSQTTAPCWDHVVTKRGEVKELSLQLRLKEYELSRFEEEKRYVLRLREETWTEQMELLREQGRRVKEEMKKEIEALQKEVEDAEDQAKEMEDQMSLALREAEERYDVELQRQENRRKTEVERLRKELESKEIDWRMKMMTMESDHAVALAKIKQEYEDQLAEKEGDLRQIVRDRERERKEEQLWRSQMEIETDTELATLRLSYEERLREKVDAVARLTSERGLLTQRLEQSGKVIKTRESEAAAWKLEAEKQERMVQTLKHERQALLLELGDRESSLRHRDAQLRRLKKECQTLSKTIELMKHGEEDGNEEPK